MGKKVGVVDGIGEGLGLAIAQKFGSEGYHIAMLARRSKALTQYQKTLAKDNIESDSYSVDVSNSSSIGSAYSHSTNWYSRSFNLQCRSPSRRQFV